MTAFILTAVILVALAGWDAAAGRHGAAALAGAKTAAELSAATTPGKTAAGRAGAAAQPPGDAAGSGAAATPQSTAVPGGVPPTAGAPLAGLTIVVDPGHGGDISWNGGATGVTGLQEKSVNLALGLALRQALQNLGAQVVMTRTADAPAAWTGAADEDPLEATTEIAAHSGAQLFVSLHGNWAENPAAEGIETYYYPGSEAGQRAAAALGGSLAAATGLPVRGPLANSYYVLHHHPVPATLLEIGYLSNPQDEALLRSQAFRAKVVAGIVSGIRNYFGR